jgi:hypothetical protein
LYSGRPRHFLICSWTTSGAGRASTTKTYSFAPENLEDGLGLLVILPEPDRQRFLGVIIPGDQLPPAHVTLPGHGRAVGDQVVVHAAVAAQPAVEHPTTNFAVRQVEHVAMMRTAISPRLATSSRLIIGRPPPAGIRPHPPAEPLQDYPA